MYQKASLGVSINMQAYKLPSVCGCGLVFVFRCPLPELIGLITPEQSVAFALQSCAIILWTPKGTN